MLAKLPDAPAGSRGISLFLVPKFLVGDDGALGARNAVHCGSIEHKMGIKASATCVMINTLNQEGVENLQATLRACGELETQAGRLRHLVDSFKI